MWGGADGCKMATNCHGAGAGALFAGVEWSSSPVTFHRNKGKHARLTKSSTVATRVSGKDYAVVFTSEPMLVGQMLKVTMSEKEEGWSGGMVRVFLVSRYMLIVVVVVVVVVVN